jgi:predicted HTH transcriptional regulator
MERGATGVNAAEIVEIIRAGESSTVQFKERLDNQDGVAAEMVAMANSKGGVILFGIEDRTGAVVGLNYEERQRINNRLASIASDLINPPVFVTTENISIDGKWVAAIWIDEGTSKPYKDNRGAIWVKQGPDKRRLTDNSEQIRLFQKSGLISLDEMIVPHTSGSDVERYGVCEYVNLLGKGEIYELTDLTDVMLENLSILRNGRLTLGGLLFFGKQPQKYRPAFCVKAVSFFGDDISGSDYRDSVDLSGAIPRIYADGIRFLTANLRHVQAGQNFNSVGKLEISEIALAEVLQNALMHRDYSKNAPIRIMIFDHRVEIVSPGALPNSLTVQNIMLGNAVVRNNLIVSYGAKLLPYRGFGSGVIRAVKNQPDIEFINDVDGEQFIVKIPRRQASLPQPPAQ